MKYVCSIQACGRRRIAGGNLLHIIFVERVLVAVSDEHPKMPIGVGCNRGAVGDQDATPSVATCSSINKCNEVTFKELKVDAVF